MNTPNASLGPDTIHRTVFPNGVVLLVYENHTVPTVVLRGQFRAGGMYDPPGKDGLAQFTAAMLSRGTEHRSFHQIHEEVESVGASVDTGAGLHLASFYAKGLAEDFSLLVDIMADILLHPTFPPEEIEKVRTATLTYLRERDDDTGDIADHHFRRLLYPNHPYGRAPEGEPETVPTITRDDLLAFYRRYYRPDGAILVVVGDMQTEEVVDQIGQALEGWQAEGTPPAWSIPPAPQPSEPHRQDVPMPDKAQADLVWGRPGPTRHSGDYFPALVGNLILGQLGLMGRLGAKVRDEQGLAYYVSSGLEAGLGEGPWAVRAGVNPNNVELTIASIMVEVERMGKEPVSPEEMDDAKSFLTGSLPLRLESNEGLSAVLLEMEIYNLGLDYIQRYPDLVNTVTREQVQEVVNRYLNPEAYVLVVAGPV